MELNDTFPKATMRSSKLVVNQSGAPLSHPQSPGDSIRRLYGVRRFKSHNISTNSSLRVEPTELNNNLGARVRRWSSCGTYNLNDASGNRLDILRYSHSSERTVRSNCDQRDNRPKRSLLNQMVVVFSAVMFMVAVSLGIIFVISGIHHRVNFKLAGHCPVNRPHNVSRLMAAMDNLFGQHLASAIITSSITHYLDSDEFQPLLLQFHGSTGVGKTFAARLIADALMLDDATVHWHISSIEHVSQWVEQRLSLCNVNVFIFEDVDLAPARIVIELRELLCRWYDVNPKIKSIFVTISSEGADRINRLTLDRLLTVSSRTDITLSDVTLEPDHMLCLDTSPFQSVLVPFLPLEREQVVQCLMRIAHVRQLQVSAETISNFAVEAVSYFPDKFPVFAKLGCKQLHLE